MTPYGTAGVRSPQHLVPRSDPPAVPQLRLGPARSPPRAGLGGGAGGGGAAEAGKKKQLRALLSTLHTILWDGAKWKPITIADVMTAPKCKKFYHKATLVVHPDKTHHLNAEQRFLAKRIFDALSQAKTQFDEQG